MSPPTVCILLLTVAQVTALMAVRPPIERWLQRERVWRLTVAANGTLLTVFLWHLTAFVVAGAVLTGAGMPLPTAGSAEWWATKPLWIVVTLAILAAVVVVASPVERKALFAPRKPGMRTATAFLAITLSAAGMSALAAAGFTDLLHATGRHVLGLKVSPLLAILLLAAGWVLALASPTFHARQRPTCRPSRGSVQEVLDVEQRCPEGESHGRVGGES